MLLRKREKNGSYLYQKWSIQRNDQMLRFRDKHPGKGLSKITEKARGTLPARGHGLNAEGVAWRLLN